MEFKQQEESKMKAKIIMVLLLSALSAGCSYSTFDAGTEGVLIYQPWFFGHGGVDETPVKVGAIWTAWSTDVQRYNIKPEKIKEPFIDLTSSDNVPIDFDAYITLQVVEGSTPVLHEDSGVEWYHNKVQDQFRMIVRNEARTRTSNALRVDESVIIEAQKSIKTKIIAYIKSINLDVIVNKVVISKVVPPQEVLDESARTAAQKQRRLTQIQREKAELSRLKAEQAAALADKGYSDKFRMTTDQFLRNKELDVMSKAVEKGKTSLIINSSNSMPTFKVN